MYSRLKLDFNFFNNKIESVNGNDNVLKDYHATYLEVLTHQRKLLNDMNHRSEFNEDLIRKYLSLIDLDEFKIREKQIEEEDVD